MIEKDIARDILPLVNDHDFFEMVKDYVQYRIEQLRKGVDWAPNMETVYKIQGGIEELKRVLVLREDVLSSLANKE